ncbi:MAG: hypothetical protein B0A82_07200 [Alkalinema sp. CACIAM 70d]|nr:MAG: hypothetical protein B0A82_07200 [Alkalinema sp. CACIAM 70d]
MLDIKHIVIADIQDRGIVVERTIAYLNLNVFLKLADFALQDRMHLEPYSSDDWLSLALSIYFLHEITHISQGIPRHEDVQAIKSINQTSGIRLLVELDLRSDYLAARTLSILETFRENGSYNGSLYEEHFYLIWCKVCRGMLKTFSKPSSREDKIRRIFGYLLMSCVIKNSYLHRSPIKLSGELLPDWTPDLKSLSISTNRQPWITRESVDPIKMQEIQCLILEAQYDDAEEKIANIWRNLPK